MVAIVPVAVAADSGGVLPWTQWALGVATAGILVLAIPAWIAARQVRSIRANLVAISIAFVAILAALQTLPLPPALLGASAPASAEVYEVAAQTIGLAPGSDQAILADKYHPLSIATWLTTQSASLMVILAAFSFATVPLFVTRSRITLLLIAISITGACQAALGIYQVAFDPNATVWGIESYLGGVPFGSFVCRNNAAVMLNIGLGAGLGLIAWRMAAITGTSINGDRFPVTEWLDVVFDRVAVIGVVCSLLCVAGLLLGGSRGGLVGGIAGLLLAFGLVPSLHSGRGLLPTLLAVGLMAAILLIKFDLPARSFERLQGTTVSLLTDDGLRDGRLDHWKDGFRAAMAQPIFGWGLGTYRYAYLPYQQSSAGVWFVNADNLWLEWFVETGVVGLCILCVPLAFFVHSLRRLNESPDPIDHGLATAGWFSLGSIGLSQFFDFGLLIPANSLLATLIASAVIGRSACIGSLANSWTTQRPPEAARRVTASPVIKSLTVFRDSSVPAIGFGLVLAIMLTQAIKALDSHARGDHWSRLAKHLPRGAQLNRDVAERIRNSLASHVAANPDDAHATIELTRLAVDLARFDAAKMASKDSSSADWLKNYQSLAPSVLRSIWYSQATAQPGGDSVALIGIVDRQNAEPQSSSLLPYRAKSIADTVVASESNAAEVPAMSVEDQRLAYGTALHETRKLAVRALLACPLSDEAQSELIGLDFAGGNSKQSEELIKSMIKLRCRHGEALMYAGRLAAQAKLWQLAASAWTQAMAIQPALTPLVLVGFPADSPISLASILPNDVRVLSIAAQQELSKNKPNIEILTRAGALLERSQPFERADQIQQLRLMARIHQVRNQPKLAADSLSKAIALSPGDLEIRYQCVIALRESGNINEARQQARAGRKIAPNDPRFEQLMTAMSRVTENANE